MNNLSVESLFLEYNSNPTDISKIIEIGTNFANASKHDAALAMFEYALSVVDKFSTEYQYILEKISVSGYYSLLPYRKENGKTACNALSFNKDIHWSTRNLARFNGVFYSNSILDICKSSSIREIKFDTSNNYNHLNPSIAYINDTLYMIQRTVNYNINEDGTYDMNGDTSIITKNYLLTLSTTNYSIENIEEISMPIDWPEAVYPLVKGFEDSRLFKWKNELWCTSTVRELNKDGYCEIVLSKISKTDAGRVLSEWKVITPKNIDIQHQKNWMPIVTANDELYFLYSSDPTTIIDSEGNIVQSTPTKYSFESFRGGSQLIPFNNGWLGIIHECTTVANIKRKYMHRFVWINEHCKIEYISDWFYIKSIGIEFVAGITIVDNRLLISFGHNDSSSWILSIELNDINAIFSNSLGDL